MNIIATVGGRPRVYRLDCQAITARLHTSHRDEVFQKSLIALSSWHTDESRGGWQAVRGSHPRGDWRSARPPCGRPWPCSGDGFGRPVWNGDRSTSHSFRRLEDCTAIWRLLDPQRSRLVVTGR